MEATEPKFKKHIFVCENIKDDASCCGKAGESIREKLKWMVKEKSLSQVIRVSRTGCLDVCSEGPNVLLMPDNIWFKNVNESDLDQILNQTFKGLI